MSRDITIRLTLKEVQAVISAFDAEIGLSRNWANQWVGNPRANRYLDEMTIARALQYKFIVAAVGGVA